MSEKICIICGDDVTDRPRVKDGQGRYACKSCVEQRKTARATRGSRSTSAAVVAERSGRRGGEQPDDGAYDLAEALSAAAAVESVAPAGSVGGIREMKACPVCERPVGDDQVICLNCGAEIESGRKSKTRVHDRAAGEAPARPSLARSAVAAAFAVAGAGIGLGIWIPIAHAAGHSVNTMVVAVGALSSGLMLIPLRGDGRVVPGAICAAITLAACAAGIALSPDDRVEGFEWQLVYDDPFSGESFEAEVPVVGLDESQQLVIAAAWVLLGTATAFGVGSSSPFDHDDDEEGDA